MSDERGGIPGPALAVLGAAAVAGDVVSDRLSDVTRLYARLADRGASRMDQLITHPLARTLADSAVAAERDLEDAVDELHDRGEELLGYVELYRWRLTRRGRDLATRPLRGIAHSTRHAPTAGGDRRVPDAH